MVKSIKSMVLGMAAIVVVLIVVVVDRAISDCQMDYDVDHKETDIPNFKEVVIPYLDLHRNQ